MIDLRYGMAFLLAMLGCELVGGIEQRTPGAEPSATMNAVSVSASGAAAGAPPVVGGGGSGMGGGDPCGTGGSSTNCDNCSGATCDCDGDPTNGCETDLSQDAAHCGLCGHDCLGGDCVAGDCQATLVHLGSIDFGTQLSGHIAVDAGRIYWVEGVLTQADVLSIAHDGSDPQTLASNEALTHAIAVDATHLYWARWNQFGLYRVDKQIGGMPELIESVGFQPVALALDATYVYWLTTPLRPDDGEAHIGRVTKTGSNGGPLTNSPTDPNDLALADGWLYWVEPTAKQVRRIETNGTNESTLHDTTGTPNFIAVEGSDVYWSEEQPDRVMWGGSSVPFSVEQSAPGEIAVDATHVYWVTDAGEVRRAARDGCEEPITLAGGFAGTHALALGPDSVFFTSDAGIWRLAK